MYLMRWCILTIIIFWFSTSHPHKNELLLRNGWPTKGGRPSLQPGSPSNIVTITISDTPQAWYGPEQNLSSSFVEFINLCETSVFLSIPPYRRFLMFATQSLIMAGYMFPWKGKIRWRGDDNSLQIIKILYQKVRLMIISTKLLKENKHESLLLFS